VHAFVRHFGNKQTAPLARACVSRDTTRTWVLLTKVALEHTSSVPPNKDLQLFQDLAMLVFVVMSLIIKSVLL
jgi:hypothetical protein